MKKPSGIENVSLLESNLRLGPYPPLGFVPMWDAELGNGDYFGLYWPLGKENDEPIVCDMLHDEWFLEPSFANSATERDNGGNNFFRITSFLSCE